MIRIPRAVTYVDLNILEENYKTIRAFLPGHVKILGVVKADAYGHGAIETARRLEANGVDYLGVATIDEGMELRESGIASPVLVMSGIFPWDDVGVLFQSSLTPVVYDYATLERIEEEGEHYDHALKVHVKVDTGMGRLGFLADDMPYLAERVREMKNVDVEGVMSHFSASEVRDEYGKGQVELFSRAVEGLRSSGVMPGIVHMGNSGCLTTYPDAYFDMVRVGINLYGSYTSQALRGRIALKQVMKVVSKIALLRDFPEGSPLSYGGTFVTKRATRVAYIPVGYSDGFPRILSNNGSVLIRDQRCGIVGRICMDWFLADVTRLPFVDAGEEVILLGQGETEAITADEIADHANTIPYEILCNLSKRIMRVYQ